MSYTIIRIRAAPAIAAAAKGNPTRMIAINKSMVLPQGIEIDGLGRQQSTDPSSHGGDYHGSGEGDNGDNGRLGRNFSYHVHHHGKDLLGLIA